MALSGDEPTTTYFDGNINTKNNIDEDLLKVTTNDTQIRVELLHIVNYRSATRPDIWFSRW